MTSKNVGNISKYPQLRLLRLRTHSNRNSFYSMLKTFSFFTDLPVLNGLLWMPITVFILDFSANNRYLANNGHRKWFGNIKDIDFQITTRHIGQDPH